VAKQILHTTRTTKTIAEVETIVEHKFICKNGCTQKRITMKENSAGLFYLSL